MSHEARERFGARLPAHVTMRVVDGVRLRREAVVEVIRHAIQAGGHGDAFRVVELNVRLLDAGWRRHGLIGVDDVPGRAKLTA